MTYNSHQKPIEASYLPMAKGVFLSLFGDVIDCGEITHTFIILDRNNVEVILGFIMNGKLHESSTDKHKITHHINGF